MNHVTAHNVTPVDTTVGELEPGTIFRSGDITDWQIRSDEDEVVSMYPDDGILHYGDLSAPVYEIAESVTITKTTEE